MHSAQADLDELEALLDELDRLSEGAEGHLSNFERTLDGFLAGLSYEELLPALREVNVNPLERTVVQIDF